MPETCDGSEPLSPWGVGASAGWFDTEIVFDRDVSMQALTTMALVAYQPSPTLGAAVGLGAVVDGTIAGGDISPGPAASGSISLLALRETERRPFVLAGLSVSASRASARSTDGEEHTLTAMDLRLGISSGKTFGWITPYAAARGFAGPVGWHLDGEAATGSDAHHYTVGAGAVMRAGRRLELSVEVMPLGERSGTAAASVAL
ncbi:MAG TPA: hypothetical protein VMZ28_24365 [Kofleriaceae bacterium]|nr:hypothetical protein [Kofleriaceae bacterium]